MGASSLITSSAAFPLGSIGHKEFQSLLPRDGISFQRINPTQLVDIQKSNLPSSSSSSSVIVDVQDGFPDKSVLFSFGIAEQCGRREKILRFLSESSISDGGALDFSVISDLMGLHTLSIGMPQVPVADEFGLYEPDMKLQPQLELISPQPSLNKVADYVSHLSGNMNVQDGRIFVMGTETEVKDVLSIIAEIYVSHSADQGRQKHQMVVPYFTRRSGQRAHKNTTTKASANIQSLAPAKSVKQLRKKSKMEKMKSGRKRADSVNNTFCTDNYSHVCESLLSIFLIKNQNESALHSLKKHGHKLPGVLMQLSSGIAGAGLAVLFSVVSNLTAGRLPLSATTILNIGCGVGLVWLSLSVNMLRDTIVNIKKNMIRQKLKDDEMATRVEKSVNEVFLRAAAVMVFVVFRFS